MAPPGLTVVSLEWCLPASPSSPCQSVSSPWPPHVRPPPELQRPGRRWLRGVHAGRSWAARPGMPHDVVAEWRVLHAVRLLSWAPPTRPWCTSSATTAEQLGSSSLKKTRNCILEAEQQLLLGRGAICSRSCWLSWENYLLDLKWKTVMS